MKYEKPTIKKECPYRDSKEWCRKPNSKTEWHLCLQDKAECMEKDTKGESR